MNRRQAIPRGPWLKTRPTCLVAESGMTRNRRPPLEQPDREAGPHPPQELFRYKRKEVVQRGRYEIHAGPGPGGGVLVGAAAGDALGVGYEFGAKVAPDEVRVPLLYRGKRVRRRDLLGRLIHEYELAT
jgi:hypothetical protein